MNDPKEKEAKTEIPNLYIIGAGMIVYDQILPSVYHLQRLKLINEIHIIATRSTSIKKLYNAKVFKEAFPGQTFFPHPDLDTPEDKKDNKLYQKVLSKAPKRQYVIVAIPDQLHYEVVKYSLEKDQNVLCVKPLVLKYSQAIELEKLAYEKGLYVGIEYHKRFDRRTLLAKKHYEAGDFGEFIFGEARLIEPYYYRNSNFQNWFTVDKTDPFVYVGCHYTDMIYFLTGLKPVEVSVRGIKRKFPNGKEGYLWAHGRVVYENGAILSVINGLGYPDEGAGSNDQGISLFFEGNGKTGHLRHQDQFRGVEYSFLENIGPGGSAFNYVNPDYFKLIPWSSKGLKPVGYGYDSIEAHIQAMHSLTLIDELEDRKKLLKQIDKKGLLATPSNSSINEILTEAARLSIKNDGIPVEIDYSEKIPHLRLKLPTP